MTVLLGLVHLINPITDYSLKKDIKYFFNIFVSWAVNYLLPIS